MQHANARALEKEVRDFIASRRWDWFVTLASNHADISYAGMREHLKRWDARTNRALNQKNWARRPDERIYWIAFVEKIETNIHWHLLVQVDPAIGATARQERTERFSEYAEAAWMKLMPRGSFDCRAIDSEGVFDYIAKELRLQDRWQKAVLSREFQKS